MLRFVSIVVVALVTGCGRVADVGGTAVEDAGPEAVGSCDVRCETKASGERIVMGRWRTEQSSGVVSCCECQAIVDAFDDDTCGRFPGGNYSFEQDFACPVCSCSGCPG